MNAILTLALKDVKLLFRDKFALFWIFAFPLMFAFFFGLFVEQFSQALQTLAVKPRGNGDVLIRVGQFVADLSIECGVDFVTDQHEMTS